MMATIPNRNDVLFGRGHVINAHPGNQRYRSMVELHKQKFLQAKKKKDKRAIAGHIVNEINSLQPAGRFLMEIPAGNISMTKTGGAEASGVSHVHSSILNKVWVRVDADKVMSKVMHRLREKAVGGSGDEQQPTQQDTLKAHSPDIVTGNISKPETFDDYSNHSNNELGVYYGSAAGSVTPLNGSTDSQNNTSETRAASGNLQLDEELISFLVHDVSARHDDRIQHLQEITLQQWIEKLHPTTSGSPEEVYKYVKSALPIALKLTEFLIEAENDETNGHRNPIPLESVAAENVLIRGKSLGLQPSKGLVDGSEGFPLAESLPLDLTDGLETKENEDEDVTGIDYVMIMSCVGENPDAGENMSRLFALGIVLYELFSGEEPLFDEDMPDNSNVPSIFSISLSNESKSSHRPRKKCLSHSRGVHSKGIARLESLNIHHAVIFLVKNLLDCSHGDFCGDETYTSLEDVRLDLQLMFQFPSRFLDNIETNPMPQLLICNKLYGREHEIAMLEQSYQQHVNGKCSGVIVRGKAGVGKSKLAMHVQELQSNSYFLVAKFDQNKDAKPLSKIGTMFNELCDLFIQEATHSQLKLVEEALESSLGTQAALLASVLPCLTKIMPSCAELSPATSNCVDSAMSMRFLFSELLGVIASHSCHISFLLDDLQWSDQVSLLLIESLISSIECGSKSVFFTCCYRDDEVDDNGPFNQWLLSISMTSLQTINLKNMTVEGVNNLVSDALRLSPRITFPLSSVLHHKAGGGNPLFLRQLIESLKEQGFIYVNLSYPRWAWDLDKIMDLTISDDVVALLIGEMQRLHTDLQWGLKIAACIGSSMKDSIRDILSTELFQNSFKQENCLDHRSLCFVGQNLQDIMQQVSEKGFMNNVSGAVMFAHDKIQQAAYEMMPEQQRREYHMRFGLAICAHTLNDGVENDELFFTAVNQINIAGSSVVEDNPSHKDIIAHLNLKAGRLSISFSDFTSAFKLFQHGISFLNPDHWNSQYELSIDLFDAAAEAACVLNDRDAAALYAERLISNAKCYDDKLNCLYSAAKALRHADLLQESMESTFDILEQLGEELPRESGDDQLNIDMQLMNDILQKTPDDLILIMEATKKKKIVTLMKLYANLSDVLHFTKPSLISSVSLRMVDLTMKTGLNSISPLAFAYYGEILTSIGNLTEGCRLGRLALKLLEKKVSSSYKASVICYVYQTILWASTPLQTIASAHMLGEKAGRQAGDVMFTTLNLACFHTTSFVAGQNLDTVRINSRDFIWKMLSRNSFPFVGPLILLHSQCAVLKEGLHILEAGRVDNNIPCEKELLANARFLKHKLFLTVKKVHQVVRAFLFRQLDEVSLDDNISDIVLILKKAQLRPLLLMGIFFEGLVSFQHARKSNNETGKWMEKGEFILVQMKCWSDHSTWNWGNKMFLLEAEKMYIMGEFDRAESLYMSSIRSANEHIFLHEEAIASELAGEFFYERGFRQKSSELLLHAQKCYEKWGAFAVARRVETCIESKFGSDYAQLEPIDDILQSFFSSEDGSSNKRRGRHDDDA